MINNKKNKELNIELPVIVQLNPLKYINKSPTNKSPTNKSPTNNMPPNTNTEYTLYFDGCSKGNPGSAGIGAVIFKLGEEEWCGCQYIGKKTNNQSEYSALIFGLKEVLSRDITQLLVFGDSLLVINQVKGVYKLNNKLLQELYQEAMGLISKFEYIEFTHVYRKFNKRADQLSNMALDVIE